MNHNSIMEFCPVPPPYGGVTVYVKRLSDQLRKDGYIIGGYYTSECKSNTYLQSSFYYKVDKLEPFSSKYLRAVNHLKRLVRNIYEIKPFSIIHYHGLENLKLLWLLHRYYNKKVIITVHSAMIESFYRRTTFINRYYMRKLAGANIQWIAVSEQAKQCMLRLPFTFRNDIPVIPAYLPIPQGNTNLLSDGMQDYINTHPQNIAFYARSFMDNDGLDVYGFEAALHLYAELLKIYDNTLGMVFCLSEDKDTQRIEKLYSMAKNLDVYDKIYWQIGAIDNINLLWKNIDVYIRPTSTDGDSVAVREVLDQGTQVVASDVCWRPANVKTYLFGNQRSFVEETVKSLQKGRSKASPNFDFYYAMKDIFERI